MKWKSRLDELGLDVNNVSQGLKTKIKDYYDIQSGITELERRIENPSVNDDVDQLQEDLEECEETLEALDDKLVKDVEYYNKHKDKYAEMTKKLAEGRAKKKQASGGVTPTSTPTKNEPPKTKDPLVTSNDDKKEEKKGSGFGWVLFAVVAGVVTLGAVNLLKNND
jgi:chromosome segregation ATPase